MPDNRRAQSIILFNKPFGVLSQFTDTNDRQTLANYIKYPGFYPAGRLDKDSEGLLLLTNNGKLQQRISDPKFKLNKTYLVQVDGSLNQKAINQLRKGVMLKDGFARVLDARITQPPDSLWDRHPPIRVRKHIPTSWLTITINEGRNRQIRRMTAAVEFPTLRLIRTQVGPYNVWPIEHGSYDWSTKQEFEKLTKSR